MPLAGAGFIVVRHDLAGSPKSVPAVRSETVGTIRVESVGNDGCAAALLLRGDARSLDWVAVAAKP